MGRWLTRLIISTNHDDAAAARCSLFVPRTIRRFSRSITYPRATRKQNKRNPLPPIIPMTDRTTRRPNRTSINPDGLIASIRCSSVTVGYAALPSHIRTCQSGNRSIHPSKSRFPTFLNATRKRENTLSLGTISSVKRGLWKAVYVIYFRHNLASGWPRVTNIVQSIPMIFRTWSPTLKRQNTTW